MGPATMQQGMAPQITDAFAQPTRQAAKARVKKSCGKKAKLNNQLGLHDPSTGRHNHLHQKKNGNQEQHHFGGAQEGLFCRHLAHASA